MAVDSATYGAEPDPVFVPLMKWGLIGCLTTVVIIILLNVIYVEKARQEALSKGPSYERPLRVQRLKAEQLEQLEQAGGEGRSQTITIDRAMGEIVAQGQNR